MIEKLPPHHELIDAKYAAFRDEQGREPTADEALVIGWTGSISYIIDKVNELVEAVNALPSSLR